MRFCQKKNYHRISMKFQKPITMETPKQGLLFWFSLSILSLTIFPTAKSQEISTDPSYYYNICAPSSCANLTISYPFSLSHFCRPSEIQVTCPKNEYLLLSSKHQTDSSRVVSSIYSDSISDSFLVASNALFGCGRLSWPDYTVDPSIFSLANNYTYGTHLNCTTPLDSSHGVEPASCLGCPGNADSNVCYYSPGFVKFDGCEGFFLFIPDGFNVSAEKDLKGFLRKGYIIKHTKPITCQGCQLSGGRCGFSPSGDFRCFCPSSVHRMNCSDGVIEDLKSWVGERRASGVSKRMVISLSASSSVVALLLLSLGGVFIFYHKRKAILDHNIEHGINDEIQKNACFNDIISGISPSRYSYSQIKKFSKNFSTKLGEGGSGRVYKGLIQENGHEILVAIKLLNKSKQSEKQFMNEVATVGRIHHNNLVRLLGYCAHHKKRALVYEFMEKGSLDGYIYLTRKEGEQEGNEGDSICLSPKQLHTIAMETARGMLYLHEGCRSRILHCDIKPHNVLLDSKFSAKVADFGLARMMGKDHSHISLTAGRGTPGYAAPEMWTRSYGPVTEKSDVYSFGMLILEIASGRRNYDSSISTSSQVYFPEWVFMQVKNETFDTKGMGTLDGIGDDKIIQNMCLVGLWCIQHIPSNRPSMSKVIQMLEGNVDIETPPHPFPKDKDDTPKGHYTTSTTYYTAIEEPFENSRLE